MKPRQSAATAAVMTATTTTRVREAEPCAGSVRASLEAIDRELARPQKR
jgi:hypothetical protein